MEAREGEHEANPFKNVEVQDTEKKEEPAVVEETNDKTEE